MNLIFSFLFQLLVIGGILILVMGLLSPFESLGWWAGWTGRPANRSTVTEEAEDQEASVRHDDAQRYVVYLSGIGAISGDFLETWEVTFLDKLEGQSSDTAVVRDVFPYAMNNNGLTGHRFFARVWTEIKRRKMENKLLLTLMIDLRNVFQVAVSADLRYGPVYNYGTAGVIRDGLLRKGYLIGSGKPVTLIGYSGGGQISLGSALYLQSMIRAPLRIISLGGVMADDPGLGSIEHLYHLYGAKDPVQRLGAILFAGRWPVLPHSPWNRAKMQGKITLIPVGPVGHNDPGGYFLAKVDAENGSRIQDSILELVVELVEHHPEGRVPLPLSGPPAQA